jgi:hypothetical protein
MSLVITEKPSRDEVLMTPEQVAERWSVNVATLANQRSRGVGPRYRKIGKLIRYPEWAIFAYEIGEAA